MKKNNTVSNLQKLIDVNIPIIYIDDYDYARVDEMLAQACAGAEMAEWNPASGYTDFSTKEPVRNITLKEFLTEMYGADRGRVGMDFVVLREINEYVQEADIKSLLTHIAQRKLYDRKYGLTVIVSDPEFEIPQALLPYVSILPCEIPDEAEINRLIDEHIEANEFKPESFTDRDRQELMPSLRGLSLFEIDRVLDMAMSVNGGLSKEDKEMILSQKKAQVKKSGLIDLVETKEKLDDIGGLDKLKEYLKEKSMVMAHLPEAERLKISIPKGVFIVGMPGCGKSLCAKAAAARFGCPLLKLDMGSMMGKYVGQSESNLRKAIKIAEAAAPCILWIDEIEKGFSGIGGNNDIMTRMFGYFLSWMQDKTSPVYVIATANNADNLPPELKRKGRFDEIFCVNLPNDKEREAIFKVHLRKKGQEKNVTSLDKVVGKTKGFNGADIESVVNEALEKKFVRMLADGSTDGLRLTEKDLQEVAEKTVSISKSCSRQIESMKKVFAESSFTDASN